MNQKNTKEIEVVKKGPVTWCRHDIQLCDIFCEQLKTHPIIESKCKLFGENPEWLQHKSHHARLEGCLRATGHLLEDEDVDKP